MNWHASHREGLIRRWPARWLFRTAASSRRALTTLLPLICTAAAGPEPAHLYRCVDGDAARDIRIVAGEWYFRDLGSNGAEMRARGCNSERRDGAYALELRCVSTGDVHSLTTIITPTDGNRFSTVERLYPRSLRYEYEDDFGRREASCRVITGPEAGEAG